MDPKDLSIVRKSQVLEFNRTVVINEVESTLTVELHLNGKTGTFALKTGLAFNQVTEDEELNGATIEVLGDLTEAAIKYGHEWRSVWLKAKYSDNRDENQLTMFGDGMDSAEYADNAWKEFKTKLNT